MPEEEQKPKKMGVFLEWLSVIGAGVYTVLKIIELSTRED